MRELHDTIHTTYRSRSRQWSQTCEEFHSSYDSLAYPGGLEKGLAALRSGDAAAIELAIEFLEVDPMFFRSGYIKAKIVQRLKALGLTPTQVGRLNQVILHLVETRDCREFRRYCHARKTTGPDLENELRQLLAGGDADVTRRAKWVLDAIAT